MLGIRSALGLFANLRPAKIYGPLKDACPLRPSIVGDDMDLLVVRELTGGIYFGRRGRDSVDGAESAYDTERYSVPEVERIARVAFDTAAGAGAWSTASIRPMSWSPPGCGGKPSFGWRRSIRM